MGSCSGTARRGKKKEKVKFSTKVLSGTPNSVFSSFLFEAVRNRTSSLRLQAATASACSASSEGAFKGAVSECGFGVSVRQPRSGAGEDHSNDAVSEFGSGMSVRQPYSAAGENQLKDSWPSVDNVGVLERILLELLDCGR